MKRFLVWMIVAASLLAVSCEKLGGSGGLGGPIRVKVTTQSPTKGATITTSTLASFEMMAMTEDYIDHTISETVEQHPANGVYFDAFVKKSGSSWDIYDRATDTSPSEKLWINDHNIIFWSWSPFNVSTLDITTPSATSNSLIFTYTLPTSDPGDDATNQPDLVFAGNVESRTFTDGTDDITAASSTNSSYARKDNEMDIVFHHPLSKIQFGVDTSDNTFDKNLIISRIELGNISNSGTCTFTLPSTFDWDEETGTTYLKTYSQDYAADFSGATPPTDWPLDSTTGLNIASNSFFFIPQSSTGVPVKITFTLNGSSQTKEATIPDGEWLADNYYTYKIKAQGSLAKLSFSLSLADWAERDNYIPIYQTDMRKFNIILGAALLAGAVSCNERFDTDGLVPIKFSADFEGVETKSFMDSSDLNSANSSLTIWGFEGTTALIKGEAAGYSSADGWTLTDTYYWQSKDYTFFSYLSKDKDGNSVSGITTSTIETDKKLSVNARTFGFNATDDNAFDFCYSGVVLRAKADADQSPVDMSLKHLYAAIGFSTYNYTDSDITLKEVTVVGLKNKKSAVIDFSDGAKVSYPTDDVACTWDGGSKALYSDVTGITIAADSGYANIVGTPSTTAQYFMFWPQTATELTATGWSNNQTEPTGGAYIKVVYSQDGSDFIRYARFPQDNDGSGNLGWPGGSKRMMQIAFRDQQITLKMQVLDWNYFEPEIKYDDEVTVAQALLFDSSTCTIVESDHKVYFNSLSTPVTGSFHISAPSEATWVISKQGHFDAFEIDDVTLNAEGMTAGRYGDHLDRNYGAVNVTDGNKFTLYPMPVTNSGDYSIQLSFSIRYPDGESYCIDDKIQPVKWTIVFTK